MSFDTDRNVSPRCPDFSDSELDLIDSSTQTETGELEDNENASQSCSYFSDSQPVLIDSSTQTETGELEDNENTFPSCSDFSDSQPVLIDSSTQTETAEQEDNESTSEILNCDSSGALDLSRSRKVFILEGNPKSSKTVLQCDPDLKITPGQKRRGEPKDTVTTAVVPSGSSSLLTLQQEGNPSCSQTGARLHVPDSSSEQIKIILVNRLVWLQFHENINEVRVDSRHGYYSSMSPSLLVRITGLKPNKRYSVYLEFHLRNIAFWKIDTRTWITEDIDSHTSTTLDSRFAHPDSPNYGSFWISLSNGISFKEVQLSSNFDFAKQNSLVHLLTYRTYRIAVNVVELDCSSQPIDETLVKELFPETDFIAVPCYKNRKIGEMKKVLSSLENLVN